MSTKPADPETRLPLSPLSAAFRADVARLSRSDFCQDRLLASAARFIFNYARRLTELEVAFPPLFGAQPLDLDDATALRGLGGAFC